MLMKNKVGQMTFAAWVSAYKQLRDEGKLKHSVMSSNSRKDDDDDEHYGDEI